eukprot:1227701-Rhodomonas_salina.1
MRLRSHKWKGIDVMGVRAAVQACLPSPSVREVSSAPQLSPQLGNANSMGKLEGKLRLCRPHPAPLLLV